MLVTPVRAASTNPSANTPSGVIVSSQDSSTPPASRTARVTSSSAARGPSAMRVTANANGMVNTSRGSSSPSAAARNGLFGTSATRICERPRAPVAAGAPADTALRKVLKVAGSSRMARISGGTTTSVNAKPSSSSPTKLANESSVMRPRPRPRGTPPIASTRLASTSGSTTIRSALIHIAPTGSSRAIARVAHGAWNAWAAAPIASPSTRAPSEISAIRMLARDELTGERAASIRPATGATPAASGSAGCRGVGCAGSGAAPRR